MRVQRSFERRGPLFLPRYDVDRVDRYYHRPRMTFTHVQGISGDAGSSPLTVTWGTTPTAGNLICAVFFGSGYVSLTDGNGVPFTLSPSSPWTAENMGLAILKVPASPSTTMIFTNSGGNALIADEFSFTPTGGQPIISIDATGTGSTGTTINTPSITATYTGELEYAGAAPGAAVTAPTSGATLGGWTGSGGGVSTGAGAEYILSATTAAKAVDFTQSSSNAWSAMAMAIYILAGQGWNHQHFDKRDDIEIVGY